MTFTELLFCNDEFSFKYDSIKYAVVSENGKRSIYEESSNRLICEFSSNNDLISKGTIKGKKILDILEEIEIL